MDIISFGKNMKSFFIPKKYVIGFLCKNMKVFSFAKNILEIDALNLRNELINFQTPKMSFSTFSKKFSKMYFIQIFFSYSESRDTSIFIREQGYPQLVAEIPTGALNREMTLLLS